MGEPEYRVTIKYGTVEIVPWFKMVDGKLIGMGDKIERDADGNVTAITSVPSGCTMELG